MNREIKFRAKRLDNGQWVIGTPTRSFPGDEQFDGIIEDGVSDYPSRPISPATLGQYTGLKDRNGKEIYEGDIIRRDGDPDTIAEVVYESGEFTCVGHYRVNGQVGWMIKLGFCLEVIGNIHDNPTR